MPSNNIYSWGNMPSVDTGLYQKPDGSYAPIAELHALEGGPVVPDSTPFGARENDRNAEFARLGVDYSVDINNPPAVRQPPVPEKMSRPARSTVAVADPTPPLLPMPVPTDEDEIWDEIASTQDRLRKLFLGLAKFKQPGRAKWLMANINYLNTAQVEGVAIRMGYQETTE